MSLLYNNQLEQGLSSQMFSNKDDRSFSDKILAKSEVDEIKQLIQQEKITSSDLSKILYLMAGNELKLLNLSENQRHIIGLYYAWIRDIVLLCQVTANYQKNMTTDRDYARMNQGKLLVTKETYLLVDNLLDMMLADSKYLIDVYFYLQRSSLSLGAYGFDVLTQMRYDYKYSQDQQAGLAQTEKGLINKITGR